VPETEVAMTSWEPWSDGNALAGPGVVARCPGCGQVLLRVRGPGRAWLDLRGPAYLQVPVPADA
jgi:Family of unknown function (DUF6510)